MTVIGQDRAPPNRRAANRKLFRLDRWDCPLAPIPAAA